jgi:hypothetical protein
MDITFLADGLMAEGAAERVMNPSAVRVPVAVAVPRNPILADLMSGLMAASLPGAEQLLVQSFGSAEEALHALEYKYNDRIAAVLGAHYLARFSPTKAPVPWLENLSRLLPNVADALTLLAWRLIAEGSTDDRKISRGDIREILLEAEARPCCLFARTRALLTQAARLYGRKPEIQSVEPTAVLHRVRTGDFLNVAADASGLEAFWGSSPSRPGRPKNDPKPEEQGVVIHLAGGSFKAVT